jgi:DNA primase
MPLFPANFVEDLKSHVDIVQVVQERVPLKKAGVTWKGLCPFHGEKTPSFHVNGEKGFFHCFGCSVGGDVIKFVELYDKVSFPDAVRQLAARAGLQVPEADEAKHDVESQREREAILKAHEVAAAWFREQLAGPAGAAARRLLRDRGMSAETTEMLGMGYAPAG